MNLTTTRSTRRLTRELPQNREKGGWHVHSSVPDGFEEAILASYACDCTGHTLMQVRRAPDVDNPIQLTLTCYGDGSRIVLPMRRMPWIVEDYMKVRELAACGDCGERCAELQTFDGVIVGVELDCPLCRSSHAVDLSLAALPAKLRWLAFGIEPPAAMMSPPVYDVLRVMWECIQRQPGNEFSFVPYTIRDDSGILVHKATGTDIEVNVDHLAQLVTAGLVEDSETISISKPGVIVCLREFGQNRR